MRLPFLMRLRAGALAGLRRICTIALLGCVIHAGAGEFLLQPDQPTLDRWMYPFNFQPGTRPVSPTYGSFDPRFDTRDAQFLLGWDTDALVPTNASPARYLIRRAEVTVVSVAPVPPSTPFIYDPTHDSYLTYATNQPGFMPDSDPGRPVELYGAAFRNGFAVETFLEASPFGELGPISGDTISIGTRNAFAAVFDSNGELIDIANNVGQMNAGWTNAPFEVRPWAVGTTPDIAPGSEVPGGARIRFSIDLGDPLIVGYLQRALATGKLRLFISSLSPAGQSTPGGTGGGGAGSYPLWATRENLLYDPPTLEIEGTLVSDADTDADGLPDDWEIHWFTDLAQAAEADPDHDGAPNLAESAAGTDPTSGDSVLRIDSIQSEPDGRVRLRFPFAPSRQYEVVTSTNLITWSPLMGTLTYPERGIAEWVEQPAAPLADEAPAQASQRFFRIRVE